MGRLTIDSVNDEDVSVAEHRLFCQPDGAGKPHSRANRGEMSRCGLVRHSTRDQTFGSLTSRRTKSRDRECHAANCQLAVRATLGEKSAERADKVISRTSGANVAVRVLHVIITTLYCIFSRLNSGKANFRGGRC